MFPAKWFGLDFQKHSNGEYVYVVTNVAEARGKELQVDPPKPASLMGRAKFVTEGERAQSALRPLGYEITVGLHPVDPLKLPSGVTNVEITVDFTFILKDKDGFVLDTLPWERDNRPILAGQTRSFKGVTTKTVSLANARDVVSIDCEMTYTGIRDDRPSKPMSKEERNRMYEYWIDSVQ